MGGGDCIPPHTNEETKAMDVDTNDAPAPATIIPPGSDAAAALQVNEENKDADNDDKGAVRKGKTSYVWSHFTALP
ncbi:hypothetical protein PIB30_068048, partial [Stylosanthes scabra]|nr:hypothetical protein [Stylosanthes scabra]